MAEVKTTCDSCSKEFTVIVEAAITNLTCPHCGNRILNEAAVKSDDPLHLQETA